MARVPTEVLVGDLADQQMPGALHIPCGEWLTVVPLDAVAQIEGKLGLGWVPRPGRGEIGHNSVQSVEWLRLIKHDEVVVERHERLDHRVGGLFMQGGARWVVAMVEAERATLLLCCHRDSGTEHGANQCD